VNAYFQNLILDSKTRRIKLIVPLPENAIFYSLFFVGEDKVKPGGGKLKRIPQPQKGD